jgi:hypothetical protein
MSIPDSQVFADLCSDIVADGRPIVDSPSGAAAVNVGHRRKRLVFTF